MIATKCDGCDRIVVFDPIEKAKIDATPILDGHHVIPDDQETDWICYGRPVEINNPAVLLAFQTRSVYGVEAFQPTKQERIAKGDAYYNARKSKG